MKISVNLDVRSIDRAIKELQDYAKWLEEKTQQLAEKLATLGAVKVSLEYSRVAYIGNRDYQITVERDGEGYRVLADGESVLFLEFGAGATYGYGHPLNAEFGMGPGTYPPTDPDHPHWNDPNGWHIPGGLHSYGNAPSMGMYLAARDMRNEIETIAKEVFSH